MSSNEMFGCLGQTIFTKLGNQFIKTWTLKFITERCSSGTMMQMQSYSKLPIFSLTLFCHEILHHFRKSGGPGATCCIQAGAHDPHGSWVMGSWFRPRQCLLGIPPCSGRSFRSDISWKLQGRHFTVFSLKSTLKLLNSFPKEKWARSFLSSFIISSWTRVGNARVSARVSLNIPAFFARTVPPCWQAWTTSDENVWS